MGNVTNQNQETSLISHNNTIILVPVSILTILMNNLRASFNICGQLNNLHIPDLDSLVVVGAFASIIIFQCSYHKNVCQRGKQNLQIFV